MLRTSKARFTTVIAVIGALLIVGCTPRLESLTVPTTTSSGAGATAPATATIPADEPEATPPSAREIELVSRASDGTPGNSHSADPSLSADGRWVVFQSHASNLVPGDHNECRSAMLGDVVDGQCPDIFLRDRQAGTTERISVPADGSEANGESFRPLISADGQWIAFYSRADNLVPEYAGQCAAEPWPENCTGLYLYSRASGQLALVTVMSDNGGKGSGPSRFALSFSGDGQWLAFSEQSYMDDPLSLPCCSAIRNQQTGEITPLELATAAEGYSISPSISNDGRLVAVYVGASWSPSSDPDDAGWSGIALLDHETGTATRLVDVVGAGHRMAADGNVIAFDSGSRGLDPNNDSSCGLDPGSNVPCTQLYSYDLRSHETARISESVDGEAANKESYLCDLSTDGQRLLFISGATNLLPDSLSEGPHLLLYDRQEDQIKLLRERSLCGALSGDATWYAFLSDEALAPDDTQMCQSAMGTTNCLDIYMAPLNP